MRRQRACRARDRPPSAASGEARYQPRRRARLRTRLSITSSTTMPGWVCRNLARWSVSFRYAKRLRGGDAQAAGETVVTAGNVAVEGERLIFHALRRRRHPLARRRRLVCAAGKPFEQADTKPRLQGIQAPERSRVVDIKRFGGAGETACPIHRQHELGLVPVLHGCSAMGPLQFRKRRWRNSNALSVPPDVSCRSNEKARCGTRRACRARPKRVAVTDSRTITLKHGS